MKFGPGVLGVEPPLDGGLGGVAFLNQSPGWTYVIVLYASSGRRVTGSPGAGCQPGFDLGLRPADGADSDFQRLRERPVAHFSVNCAASESGAGLYLAKAQEAIGSGGGHEPRVQRGLWVVRVKNSPNCYRNGRYLLYLRMMDRTVSGSQDIRSAILSIAASRE